MTPDRGFRSIIKRKRQRIRSIARWNGLILVLLGLMLITITVGQNRFVLTAAAVAPLFVGAAMTWWGWHPDRRK